MRWFRGDVKTTEFSPINQTPFSLDDTALAKGAQIVDDEDAQVTFNSIDGGIGISKRIGAGAPIELKPDLTPKK